MQKSVAFVHPNNEQAEKQIRKITHSQYSQKQFSTWDKPNKGVRDLYNETINQGIQKLKKTLNDRKTTHVHGLAELKLCKWLSSQFQCNPYTNFNHFSQK
jgi:hypothetical protein